MEAVIDKSRNKSIYACCQEGQRHSQKKRCAQKRSACGPMRMFCEHNANTHPARKSTFVVSAHTFARVDVLLSQRYRTRAFSLSRGEISIRVCSSWPGKALSRSCHERFTSWPRPIVYSPYLGQLNCALLTYFCGDETSVQAPRTFQSGLWRTLVEYLDIGQGHDGWLVVAAVRENIRHSSSN